MNNQILRLEKQSAALLSTISELLKEDTLTQIDKDHLKHQCLLLYELILELAPAEENPMMSQIMEPAIQPVQKVQEEIQEFQPVAETTPVEQTIALVKEEEPLNVLLQQKPLFEEELTLNDLAKATETTPVKQPETETEIRNKEIDVILDQQQKVNAAVPPVVDVELSLHEKIAHSIETRDNLIGKLSATIPSLKNAINVNLKIALVNQLFNDNTVEYVKAIDKLNSCENIHEAMRYFNELKHQYVWDSENHNVKELEQLLNKRYGN